jgi:hypothetical protein
MFFIGGAKRRTPVLDLQGGFSISSKYDEKSIGASKFVPGTFKI